MNNNRARITEAWELELKRALPLLGHRNWIVVADSAYPAQSNPGIQTIATGADHIDLLRRTLNAIAGCKHIRANVYLDAELKFISEEDAPGVDECRRKMDRLLNDRNACALQHEQIISKLDASGRLFRVLILKSTLAIPYTSIFLELDCGYWNNDAEARLRSALAKEAVSVGGVSVMTRQISKSVADSQG